MKSEVRLQEQKDRLQRKIAEMQSRLRLLQELACVMPDDQRKALYQLIQDAAYLSDGVTQLGADVHVVFTFDDAAWEALEQMIREGHYGSKADGLRESLQLMGAIRSWHKEGFTEVICRNPITGRERQVFIPSLRGGRG